MTAIKVNRFLGIAPKIGATVLNAAQAQVARNAKLWSQELRPFFGLGGDTPLTKTGDIQTIYLFNSTIWLHWTQDVDVVRGAIANDALEKTYFTGTDKPRVTTNDIYNLGTTGTFRPPDSYILGIPAPVGPPVATLNGAGNITATSTWRYTFVRKFSDGTIEESAPSVPSNVLVLAAQQASVTMPNGAITAADYGITHKRLYRSDNGTVYFFVSESTIATSPAADNVATANLGNAIETTSYLPPPDGMTGLIMLPNGVTAGFYKNTVYLSEPYKPHAYPALNQYTVNFPIVALGNVGTSIVVGTTGVPFVGRGVDPAQYSFKPSPAHLPCVSKRSMKSSEFGAFYASSGGVAGFDGSQVQLVTREFLMRDEWQADFYPTTIHAAIYDGRYFGWFTTGVDGAGTKIGGGFVLDKSEAAFLVNLDEYVYAAHAIAVNDQLWVQRKNPFTGLTNYVYQWEANPADPKTYEWKSKQFISNGAENFAFAQVIGDFGIELTNAELAAIAAQVAIVRAANNALTSTSGALNGNAAGFELNGGPLGGDNETQMAPAVDTDVVSFTYWADGVLKLQRDIYNSEPFPLPSGFTAEIHEFRIAGNVDVSEVTLATSMEELAGA